MRFSSEHNALLLGLAALAALVAVATDLASSLWTDYPMIASLVSGVITLAIAGLVVDAAIERRHRQRWAAVREVALRAIESELTNLERDLTSPDGPWTQAVTVAPRVHSAAEFQSSSLRHIADRLEQIFAQWGAVVLGVRGPDHEVFDGVRTVLVAGHELARAERVMPAQAAYFRYLEDGQEAWATKGYPPIARILQDSKAEALDAANRTRELLDDRLK